MGISDLFESQIIGKHKDDANMDGNSSQNNILKTKRSQDQFNLANDAISSIPN